MQPVFCVKLVPNIGPEEVKESVCWLPFCSKSLSIACILNEIGSPALIVASKELPGNGALIVGAAFKLLQAKTTNCISRSTSEIRIP